MNYGLPLKLIALGALAAASIVSGPAHASTGCSEFRGRADDQTKGEGGSRVGEGFSKGDTLTVTIHEAPGKKAMMVDLLQYSSPNAPFTALVEDTSDDFTYTVPASTRDFIYLNFGGPWPGMIVTWRCMPAKIGSQISPGRTSADNG